MRNFIICSLITGIFLMPAVLMTSSAGAAEEAPNYAAKSDAAKSEERADRRAEMRQKMLGKFDADGDGELSDDERATARAAARSRRGNEAREGKTAVGKRAQGAKRAQQGAKRAKQGAGNRRAPGGPGGRPDPARLFDEYDANGDGQLSRKEFMKLSEAVRPPRPPRGPRQRGSARPDGPPQAGRPRFDRDRPLQNRGDRPGPPARSPAGPAARHRLFDQDARGHQAGGPGERRIGRRGPGKQGPGPGSRGPGGEGPLNPARVLERFDENDDGQLSRDELTKLTDRMHQMRQRGRPQGGPGVRDGNRPGDGPARGDGPPRRRRPPRPETEASDASGAEDAVSDDSV